MAEIDERRTRGAFGAFIRGRNGTEAVLVLVIFAYLLLAFTAFKAIRTDLMRGDSAMYFQATENLARRGLPVSQVQASIVNFQEFTPYLTMSADQIAKNPIPLFGEPRQVTERNLLLGHTYFILYPIALLVKFLPVTVVLLGLFAFSFIGMLLLAYVALRRKGLSVVGAGLFCLLIVAQPAWWSALLGGQFYPDRFFVLAGFAVMILSSRRDAGRTGGVSNRLWLLAAVIVTASINERAAIVAGLFLTLYGILYWRVARADGIYRVGLGVAAFAYGYGALKYIELTNPEYNGFFPSSVGDLIYMVQQPRFIELTTLFLLVNAPLLFFAAFQWRALVIALVLMLPNILGNIGGAEKTGWATHYPSFFFPSLVWAGLNGYFALTQSATSRKAVAAVYAVAAALVLYLCMLDPDAYNPPNLAKLGSSFLPQFVEQADLFLIHSDARASLRNAADGIRQAVPPRSVVSSVEAGMPLLYRDRTITYFPANIDNSDYAVLGAQIIDGKLSYNGTVNYLGPVERNKENTLVVARMRRDGYDIDHPALFPGYAGLAIVRRIH